MVRRAQRAAQKARGGRGKTGLPRAAVIRRANHQTADLSTMPQAIDDSRQLSPAAVTKLQHTVGNRAVLHMLQLEPAVQRRGGAATGRMLIFSVGSSGPAVEEAQKRLNLHGAALEVDGKFGSKTRAAVRAFQQNHQDNEGNALVVDGIIGSKTRWALGQAPAGPAPVPDPSKKAPAEALREIFAKGDAMSADEAARAKTLLFGLEGDEFRKTLKEAIASGNFMTMLLRLPISEIFATLSSLTEEVVVPTTLLRPATNTIADDFKRANEIYNPHGIEIEQGSHLEIDEETAKLLIGKDQSLRIDDPAKAGRLTKEAKALIEENRNEGRITGYWVPDMSEEGLRGEAIVNWFHEHLGDRTSTVVNTSNRAQDTFPHELGHALDLKHEKTDDPNNLMTRGKSRKISGSGIDQLTDEQLDIIRKSLYVEVGKKGVGK